METLGVAEVAKYVGGKVYGDPTVTVGGLQIDSRKLVKGDLFIALKGEKTDGHRYVLAALATAQAALVETGWAENNRQAVPVGRALIAVADPLAGLQRLAAAYRGRFDLTVVGVTGSTGKTTTKDMIAAVLGERMPVHKTQANFNNELGLPLTLLGLNVSHQAAVVEMGMRGRGEIQFLCSLAKPTIGVITNIGKTHLELLGSQENIASAKGELLQALPEDGTAILNSGDPWCRKLGQKLTCKVLYYGIDDPEADVTASGIEAWGELGTRFLARFQGRQIPVSLALPGRHNVTNALAAIAVGLACGLDLAACARGLEKLQMTAMRLQLLQGPRQTRIINDAYNANPASTRAGLSVLAERAGNAPKVAVLGSMFELGQAEVEEHQKVGEYAANLGDLAYLVTVGDLGRQIAGGAAGAGMDPGRIASFATTDEAIVFLTDHLPLGAWVLVKGSRGMKMEQIVEALLKF